MVVFSLYEFSRFCGHWWDKRGCFRNTHVRLFCANNASTIFGDNNIHVASYQLKLKKMRAQLANLYHCAVPFLSRTDANLRWYYISIILIF